MTEPYSGRNTRRNIVSFIIGKVPNAFATAALLALLARVLERADFGHYVIAMATVELVLGLSTLGIDWILLRFIPEFRVNGGWRQLLGLICKAMAARGTVLLLVAGGLWQGAGLFFGSAGDFPLELAAPLVVLLVVEGMNRMVRDNCFEALAMQTSLQICTLLRSVLMIGVLVSMSEVSAGLALRVEIAASMFSLLLGGIMLVRAALKMPATAKADWQRPRWRQMAGVAFHNYANGIAEYLYSPSFLILILSRFQPASTMAGLGFVLRLVDIIRNYMPGMVVFSVVRARMIGAYTVNRNYDELQGWASFVYKISMLTLLPVLAIATISGDSVLEFASGGHFAEFHVLFAILCAWLALRLHRLILNVVCNAAGLMAMWARAATCSLFVLPLLLVLGVQHHGTWIVPLALIGGELIINILVVRGMRSSGHRWPFGLAWWSKSMLATAIASGAAAMLPGDGSAALLLQAGTLCIVYGICVLVVGTVDVTDKLLINRVIGKPLFRTSPLLS